MMPRRTDRSADPTPVGPGLVILRGRDHDGHAAVATAVTADGGVALGIARGWRPKPYAYVDPNEDAVGGVAGPRAQLLVVADGHNGLTASHRAVPAVMDAFGDDPRPADLSDDEVIAVALGVERQVAGAAAPFVPRSRTTLVAALRTATELQWFAAGDSALLVVDRGHARTLPTRTHWFVGDRANVAAMRQSLARGRVRVPASAWVVLATDGYTDYPGTAASAPAAVVEAVAGAEHPRHVVDALLEQARRGGAGDNVGVAVSGPWYKAQDGHHDVLGQDG